MGSRKLDQIDSKTHQLEVEFELPDYVEGIHPYLQMSVLGVVNRHSNFVYINDNELYILESNGLAGFVVDAHKAKLKRGTNKLKIVAKLTIKDPDVTRPDPVSVADPILIYAQVPVAEQVREWIALLRIVEGSEPKIPYP
jgi:hypothetical protein